MFQVNNCSPSQNKAMFLKFNDAEILQDKGKVTLSN